ncbi:ATP-dependent DNA ligase [Mesorhizobium sangaii]|uniref:ATP-dependent DNA ligase n=1 Tax=Mesorhizobium sangaii TaxID=505389 RepID=A0A841PE92_9HYPH|nr:ATP-dependent DNA ligase [Mesorhizobium sangaii]
MGLEGMVSKRRGSPYRSGPSDSWVKTKCWEVGDFQLLGLKREPGKQTVGLMAREGKYAGPATIALTKQMRERLLQRVQKGRAAPQGLPSAVTSSDVEWLKPGITARVRYLRGEAKLSHASLQDFRDED